MSGCVCELCVTFKVIYINYTQFLQLKHLKSEVNLTVIHGKLEKMYTVSEECN
jgi:hypothetical protein